MRHYLPNHEVTTNYIAGMRAIEIEQLPNALAILSSEPADSPCYGLALANKALVELRLEQYQTSETTAKLALTRFKAEGCPHPPTCVQTLRNLGEAMSLQGRLNESLPVFENGCSMADELPKTFPDFHEDCQLEKAHTLNSWGGTLLKAGKTAEAINCFSAGRDIYRVYPKNEVGCAETLTNLAQCYTEQGETTKASLALQEAEQLVATDPDQIHRIRIANIRLGWYSKDVSRRFLLEAAQFSIDRGFIDTAYLRHCIAAFIADRNNDCAWGMEVIRLAETLESQLSPSSLQPAKLRFYKAVFLEQSGQPVAEVLNALLEGARLWCERIPGPLAMSDYQQAVGSMHDHFRKLSVLLLREGKNDEAFVAFEIGRARAFAVEISGDYHHPFLATNPFRESAVDCALLKRIQAGLDAIHLVISLAILPPNLVAFIVGRNSLEVCKVDLVKDINGANVFGDAVRAMSAGLENGKGVGCIPDQIVALSREIAGKIGTRNIVLLAPHAMLHKVPWRSLLRHAGISWSQLPFITQFSPLLDPDCPNPDIILPAAAVALGHGSAGTGANALNLEEEAHDFAAAFGVHGQLVNGARSTAVTSALKGGKTVLLSCHGKIVTTERGDGFLFELADGGHAPDDLIQGAVTAPFVILSACSSGVYEMAWGDYPVGAAPTFLMAGAKYCICTRFPISAHFAKAFFPKLGELLSGGQSVGNAFAKALHEMELQGHDMWRHLACVELLGRGISDPK